MSLPSNCGFQLDQAFPADLACVDQFCAEVNTRCVGYLEQGERFIVDLLLREMLNNAVVHGCRQNADMRVRCSVRISDGWLTIQVIDSGPGFDWQSAMTRELDPQATSGRGLWILRRYGSDLQFNDTGNNVTLRRHLRESMQSPPCPAVA